MALLVRDVGPPQPVRIRDRHGSAHVRPLVAHAHRALFARLLLPEGEVGEWVHVWPARRGPDGHLAAFRRQPRAFVPAGDVDAWLRRVAGWHGRRLEVFAGMLPRSRPEPGASAVTGGSVVWVDVDGDTTRLEALCAERPPHYRAASGGPGGGQHAAWRLTARHPATAIAAANRRLAEAVGGDSAVCHPGASLRVPGTRNGKPGGSWCRILHADLALPAHRLDDLVGDLPDPPRPAPAGSGRPPVHGLRRLDPLAAIAPPVYFAALAGVAVPTGGGLVCCPLPGHDDRHPSCMVYPRPEDGWRCFSHPGGAGGRIYDLVSALEGGPTGRALRGTAFLAAKRTALERLARPG